ncbi:MAG: ribbon-helix-helix domain-containing protein [Promethearchaeota archaeon]
MRLISLNIPENYLKILEILVAEEIFPNRSEAIRMAIRDLIKTEFKIDEVVKGNNGVKEEERENEELKWPISEKIAI